MTLTLHIFPLTNGHNVGRVVYKIFSPVAGGASQVQAPFGGMHSQPAFGQSSAVPTFGAQQAGQPANPFGQPGAAAFGQPEQAQSGAGNGGTPSCLSASSSPCMLFISGSVCSRPQHLKAPVQQSSMECLFAWEVGKTRGSEALVLPIDSSGASTCFWGRCTVKVLICCVALAGFPAPGGGLAGNSAGSMTLGAGEQRQGGSTLARRKFKAKRK